MEFWKTIEPYVINGAFVAIVIAIVVLFLRRKRALEIFKALAETNGFTHHPPEAPSLFSKRAAVAFQDPGEVTGDLEGLPFRLYIAIYGSSKNRRVFTIMAVEIPGLPNGLTIYHENAFLKFTKLLGAQDVITGDPAFDAAFLVKGNNPAQVQTWLDSPRREAIIKYMGENRDIDIREGRLQYQHGQIVDNRVKLEEALNNIRVLVPYLKPQ